MKRAGGQVRHRGRWIASAVLAFVALAGFGFWERPASYFDAAVNFRMWLDGVRGHTVTVNGYRVHYLVEGPPNGRAVVLVHGLGSRAQAWRNLAPYLVKAGDRVYMPDLLGYGTSASPENFSYSVRAEAGVVTGFMDALGLKQVDLGGWSMGGWIAQLMAADEPQRVERLILFDSAGLADPPSWNTQLFTPTTPAELTQLNALLRPHPTRIPAFVARDILRIVRERGWVVKKSMATMLSGRDVTNTLLPKLKMPVLIVWGSADRCIPLAEGEQMHELVPKSKLDVIPGCGHLAPEDCAGRIAPAVNAFLSQ
jgi:pimeloyl-ACP methyl ester carboxylesterase